MVYPHTFYVMVMNKNISISKPLLEKDVFASMHEAGHSWYNGLESSCIHV
jgi:hypothetical protein